MKPDRGHSPRTNQERVEESTAALQAAAIELFARRGYEQTTAAEIGTYAGYSRNMVRDRFGSKEALLASLFEKFAERLLPSARVDREENGLALLLGKIDDLHDSVKREPETMRALIVLTFETPGALREFAGWFDDLIAQYESEVESHFKQGQEDGSVRVDLEPAREAEVFVSCQVGMCFRYVLRHDGYDLLGELRSWRERIKGLYAA